MVFRQKGPAFRGIVGPTRVRPYPTAIDYVSRWGVVSYWPLNEVSDGSGPVTRMDLVGSNHLTDVNTVTNGTGRIYAQCAQFTSANNEYLLCSDNASLSLAAGDEYIEGGWFNATSYGALRGMIGRRSSGTARDRATFYDTNNPSQNRFKHRLYNAAGTEIVSAAYASELPVAGTWYLVLGMHDQANDLIGISVNGSAWVTAATGGAEPGDVTANFLIGILQATTTNPWNGRAEGAIFCKNPPGGVAAIRDEVKDVLYNGGVPLAYPWAA